MQPPPPHANDDPFDLARFVSAQRDSYEQALSEIERGQKRTHWMWFVFPQLRGLGFSSTAQLYGISGIDEARAYLVHPVLGTRLIECCQAILSVRDRTATQILGQPDDLKLCSCATLFASIAGDNSVFQQVLERFFDGKADSRTLQLLDNA
ncbi:DUF1810 domain-containing protein [Stieleria sp. ICT_E10.1]|uniref:DUF1810 domain-containing protein n=1 Tax=Stieleria sedimenti TaxID=2976331 RepID=UPI0021806152|nr:DUF1810 domain-containing protein [Stieleria sedimenti]MCS7470576.1 DUF1810 domain-containing protein [Stieleria sedimenti]